MFPRYKAFCGQLILLCPSCKVKTTYFLLKDPKWFFPPIPRKSSHPALNAPETSLDWVLQNHEADDEQVVLDLPREDPRYRCLEHGHLL